MRIQSALLVIPVAAVTACASSRDNEAAEIVPSGEGRPELVGCTAYTPPPNPWVYDNRVYVEVTVRPDGSVDPSSARPAPSRFSRGGQGAVDRALDMARSCAFRPVADPTRTTIQVAFNGDA